MNDTVGRPQGFICGFHGSRAEVVFLLCSIYASLRALLSVFPGGNLKLGKRVRAGLIGDSLHDGYKGKRF